MIRSDYIMRLVEEAVRVLAKIIAKHNAGRVHEAKEDIRKSCSTLLGMDFEFLLSAAPLDVLQLLQTGSGVDGIKCKILADLLYEEARIAERGSNLERASAIYEHALALYLEARHTLPDEQLQESNDRIALLVSKSVNDASMQHIVEHLYRYFELNGAYSKAEDVLCECIELEGVKYVESLEKLYQRLLKKSDNELLAGNLPRVEIEDGLRELKRRL